MKLYLYGNSTNYKEYTLELIRKIMLPYLVDNPDDADIVMVSVCDITEIEDINKAKKLYAKPILSGGMISEIPILNELSDYVYHGEIYGLREHLDSGGTIEDCEYITTKENKKLNVYQKIHWFKNPMVQVGKRALYYYVSKGCPVKCKYCYMAYTRNYQVIPESLYNNALKIAKKNLMPIAAYNPYGVPGGAYIGETLLKSYIAGKSGSGARLLRCGIEFVNQALSKSLAKGVTLDDLNKALALSKHNGTKLILYFIAGLETQDEIDEYFSNVDIDYMTSPVITVVYTYIDPQPFTPFYDFDIRQKIGIDAKMVYGAISQRNKRFRVMPLAKMEKSTIRTLYSRCRSVEDYQVIRQLSKFSHAEIIERLPNKNYLIGTSDIEDVIGRKRAQQHCDYWSNPEMG